MNVTAAQYETLRDAVYAYLPYKAPTTVCSQFPGENHKYNKARRLEKKGLVFLSYNGRDFSVYPTEAGIEYVTKNENA